MVRRYLVELGLKEKNIEDSEEIKKAKNRVLDKEKHYFIITWAQNETPVNKSFFNNLKKYAEFINAEISVIPSRYKNPTSVFSDSKHDEWDQEVVPYLDANRHYINDNFCILSDIKIQPTASNPLNGLESIEGEYSCVVGSPRVQLKVIPSLDDKSRYMFSTGACTIKNYVSSRIGATSEFHHTYGFLIVEKKDNETYFARQVTASDEGDFTDLYYRVSNEKIERINSVEAVIMGDIHVGEHDEKIVDSTLNVLFKNLYPSRVICHDIYNGSSISHHHLNNPFLLHEYEKENKNSLKKEIEEMLNWLKQIDQYNVFIVRSNHDEHLDKYLQSTDWRKTTTLKNSIEYMEYSLAILNGKAPNGIIPYVINEKFPKIKCLGINDSYKVKGWELGVHSHLGASGSRGSVSQFRRLSNKMCIGHSHQPSRYDGVVSVGTTTRLRVGYNNSYSAWGQAHCILHHDSKIQHILFKKDKDGNAEFTTFL